MTRMLSVDEMSVNFEAYFKVVEDDRETIIITLDDKPVAEIRPLQTRVSNPEPAEG